ncbi:YdcH family protein [Litorivivens sp.]|uniref:YdcH family protein n=1 Tax=Litorivivens sp. TaxID=2020868 RepID=UPI00356A6BE9
MIEELDHKEIRARLTELRILHREIDRKILDLQEKEQEVPFHNQLELRRLKKEKLYVKDCIVRLRARIIPDLNA